MTSNDDDAGQVETPLESADSTSRIVEFLTRSTPDIRRDFLNHLASYFLASPTRPPALARALQVYAVKRWGLPGALHQDGGSGTRQDGGSWKRVQNEICALRDAISNARLEGVDALRPCSTPDTLRNFLLGNSVEPSGGSSTYCMLGLFLIDVYSRYPELIKQIRLAREDRELIGDLLLHWVWLKSGPKPGTSPLTELKRPTALHVSPEIDGDTELIRQRIVRYFAFPQDRLELLTKFFHSVAFGERGHAHFICYRPQLSRPAAFIKSFLAVIPPGTDQHQSMLARTYTFVHIYKLHPETAHKRRTVGVVLPIANGLYFVGGQENVSTGEVEPGSFRSLKVIAVPWVPIEQGRTIIPALVLSTNNQERHVVSRMAMRPTTYTSDADAGIGAVELAKLKNEIDSMFADESALSLKPDAFRRMDGVSLQVEELMRVANNRPSVDVAGYVKGRSNVTATRVDVEQCLKNAFDVGEDGLVTKSGEPLTWENLRFSALDTIV